MRHADEQYAWPRSHDAQIAKRRLQRRQVFWRSGVSTTSERRDVPTGHASQSVAQERRPARFPSEHRGGHPRVWRSKLQALTSSAATCQLTRAARDRPTKRLWTLPPLWTHRTRPQRFGNLAQHARFPQRPQPLSFSSEKTDEEHLRRRSRRFTRFQVSADTHPTSARPCADDRSIRGSQGNAPSFGPAAAQAPRFGFRQSPPGGETGESRGR